MTELIVVHRPRPIRARCPEPARDRRAFTLIELLVAVSIIGVLTAILLPAVQAAREASRRATCAANLRQIGIAMSTYESAHGMFPPAQLRTATGGAAFGLSGHVFLLPHIEQQAVYSAINMDFTRWDTANSPMVENRTARSTRLGVYLCPGDGEPEHLNSYRFNRGRFGVRPGPYPFDGPFSFGVLPRPASITDGLARTAFMSERLGGSFMADAHDPSRDIRVAPGSISSDDQFIPICLSAGSVYWFYTSGRYWTYTGTFYTDYNHNGKPNDPRPSCNGGIDAGLHPPRSHHPGIVNVLFGDGHLEGIQDGIDQKVWLALGTHDSGD